MKPSSLLGWCNLKAEKIIGYKYDGTRHKRTHDEGSPTGFCLACAREATKKV